MKQKPIHCHACADGIYELITVDNYIVDFSDEPSIVVPSVQMLRCSNCGESSFSIQECKRIGEFIDSCPYPLEYEGEIHEESSAAFPIDVASMPYGGFGQKTEIAAWKIEYPKDSKAMTGSMTKNDIEYEFAA